MHKMANEIKESAVSSEAIRRELSKAVTFGIGFACHRPEASRQT